MRPSSLSSPLPSVRLDRNLDEPLHRQLYRQIREAILGGRLPGSTKLPASRELADQLDVSRNTVIAAYRQLRVEGYVETRVGSGTRVVDTLPEELLAARDACPADPVPEAPRPELSSRGRRLATVDRGPDPAPGGALAFRPGAVAAEHFPFDSWARLSRRRWRAGDRELVHYGRAGGLRRLRQAVADYLGAFRAVDCALEQVFITSGSQQGISLAAELLLDPGDPVAVEDPVYPVARAALEAAQARLLPVPVDEEGLRTALLGDPDPPPRLVYTTPSHQYPLGVTLSITRRLELLERAREWNAWVVEDDYDSEFRYETRPLPALQGLGGGDRVVYVGTFSKILAPALRVGYLVLPEELVDPFRAARALRDHHPPVPVQAVLADFIVEGHLERHVRRMRRVYEERRDVLREEIAGEFGDALRLEPGGAGMHAVGWLEEEIDDRAVAGEGERIGVVAVPLSVHYAEPPARGGLVLGYGAVDPEGIRTGVERLARAVAAARRRCG